MEPFDLDTATLDGLSVLVRRSDPRRKDTTCSRIAEAHTKDAEVFVFSLFCPDAESAYPGCTVVDLMRLIDDERNTTEGAHESVRKLLEAAEPFDLVIIEHADLIAGSRYENANPDLAVSTREAVMRTVGRGVRVIVTADDLDDVREYIECANHTIVTGTASAYVIERR